MVALLQPYVKEGPIRLPLQQLQVRDLAMISLFNGNPFTVTDGVSFDLTEGVDFTGDAASITLTNIIDNGTDNLCENSSVSSNITGPTINNLTAGSISGDVTICSGDDPSALGSVAATGDGTITYEWFESTDNITFTTTGVTTEVFDPGVLNQDNVLQARGHIDLELCAMYKRKQCCYHNSQ